MRSTLAAASLLVALSLADWVRAAAAAAADEARFHPPAGWTVTKQPDGTTAVQPPGVPAAKTCTVLIMPDVAGEVNGVFATSWRALTGELKVVSGGEPRREPSPRKRALARQHTR